jgi:hypothetical protein
MKLTPLIAAAVVLFTLGGDARPADPPKRATGPQPETETDLIQRGISICGRSGGQRGLIPQGDEGAVDGYREYEYEQLLDDDWSSIACTMFLDVALGPRP